jgi:hypothetical protein
VESWLENGEGGDNQLRKERKWVKGAGPDQAKAGKEVTWTWRKRGKKMALFRQLEACRMIMGNG